MVFSMVLITIFHNSFSKRLSTVFSQDCAYIVREPSRRSINGRSTSSASVEPAFACAPLLLMLNKRSPNSRTLWEMHGLRLKMREFLRLKRTSRTSKTYLFANCKASSSRMLFSCCCKSFRIFAASSSNFSPPICSNIFSSCIRSCWMLFIRTQA